MAKVREIVPVDPGTGAPEKRPVTIKKYANRRLYNTASSSYVTLEDLSRMVQDGTDFVVYDAKTGEELTRAVLTQIIVEEEQKGQNLLPIGFLRQLISFYGDNMRWILPRYLEMMMQSFARNQEQLKSHLHTSFGGLFPLSQLEEMGKQNMALFEKAMQMWNPFTAMAERGGAERPAEVTETKNDATSIEDLRRQLASMQQQLDALTRTRGGG